MGLTVVFRAFGFGPPMGGTGGTIAGWRVLRNTPDAIVLGLDSPIGTTARYVACRDRGRVVVATLVKLDGVAARASWRVAMPIHRHVNRYLLGNAARRVATVRTIR